MVITDYSFSVIRDWFIGGNFPIQPSGMIFGTGSASPSFGDIQLGSPLDTTRHAFASQSGIGFTAQFEHLVNSGDIITGSIVREIGMISQSGGNLWFRELIPEVELFGSAEINSFLAITVR